MPLNLKVRPTDERCRVGMTDMLVHGSTASPSAKLRVLLLASIAALVVTTFDAHAAPVAQSQAPVGLQQASADDGAELGARKRTRARRGNSAAGLAMMGMMVGTVGAVIAAQQQRDSYRRVYDDYPPGYGPRRHYYRDPYARDPYAYDAPRGYQQRPRVYPQQRSYVPNSNAHDRLQRIDPQNPNAANPTGVPRIGW
jgi:hypothetical protein